MIKAFISATLYLTLAHADAANACEVNLIDGPIVDWADSCGANEAFARDIAEHDDAPGFKLEFDRKSFEAYYANIKKNTKIGDLSRDSRSPYEYCDGPFHQILLTGDNDNWMYLILSGAGNSEKDVKYLSKKAHDEFFSRVTEMKCRMVPTAKQAEFKIEGKTLVLEVNPLTCDNIKGCRKTTTRPNSTMDDDFHPYNYYRWMVPFFASKFPAFKEARDVAHKRYPQTAL